MGSTMIVMLAILYLVFLIVAMRFFSVREGYYSSVFVFGGSAFIFYLTIPLELYLKGETGYMLGGTYTDLSGGVTETIGLMSILALMGFCAGLRISSFRPFAHQPPWGIARSLCFRAAVVRPPQSLILLMFVALVTLAVAYRGVISSMGTYEGAFAARYANPAPTLLIAYAVLCFALIGSLQATGPRVFTFALLGGVFPAIIWGFYSSDKNPILMGFLALATALYWRRSRRKSVLFIFILGVPALLMVFPLFSLYRAGFPLSILNLKNIYYFSFTRIDPGGPMSSLAEVIRNTDHFRFGTTYLDCLTLLVPRFLWPNRPLDLAELFAQENIINWIPGQGLGYSLLAESYLNFGVAGAFIQFFAFGFLWGMFWRVIQKNMFMHNYRYFISLYHVVGYYIVLLMHRGPLAMTVKTAAHFLIVLLALFIIVDITSRELELVSKGNREGRIPLTEVAPE
jgi:oligosaccharide repeat unit polymerase